MSDRFQDYLVALHIRIDTHDTANPDEWDWRELFDFGPGEKVRVIHVQPILPPTEEADERRARARH